jgi:tRNA dimethylallyltransferase
MEELITIIGPTGIGKTTLALSLAEKNPIEIISLDSMLVYKHCNIGTAKPTKKELSSVRHHMIDILDPCDRFSVATYINMLDPIIMNIRNNKKVPILVGGTMMYLWAMINGLENAPETNHSIREDILATAKDKGWPFLWQQLNLLQPEIARKIEKNDKQRVSRALELSLTGSRLIQKKSKNFNLKIISLWPDNRDTLYNNLNNRVISMLENGLVEEVTALSKNFNQNINTSILNAVGYRQVFKYLAKEYDYKTMLTKIQQANRNLAKRQLTWMRKLDTYKINLELSLKNNVLNNANNILSSLVEQQL